MTAARAGSPRVAVVYPIPFGEEGIYGGGERYALELAKALARRTPTRLVTFGATPRLEWRDELEIRLRVPWRYVRGERFNPLSIAFVRDLRDVDVVHCVSWNTLVSDVSVLYARLARKRVFVTDVGGGASFTLAHRLRLGGLVDGFALIAPQPGQFDPWRDRWSIILGGIDAQRFRPAAGAKRAGVLFVGRLLPHKGIDVLIRAIDPGVALRVVGRRYDERYFGLLQELARGKDVTFVTDASDADILAMYQAAAVAVLPSVATSVYGEVSNAPELLGFTLLEAMSCATPVICSDALPGIVVDGESGFVVPQRDVEALASRLRLILSDAALAARLGAAARQRVLDVFTWDLVAERCLQAYER